MYTLYMQQVLCADTSFIVLILFLPAPNADQQRPKPPAEQMQKPDRRPFSGTDSKDQRPADQSMGQLICNIPSQSDRQERQDSSVVPVQATGKTPVKVYINMGILLYIYRLHSSSSLINSVMDHSSSL